MPYYRIGGVRKISVDVRIIAATNQDLEGQIGTGRFRADLFHRLAQISLQVPPLRARGEDIVPLCDHFLRLQNPDLHLAPCAVRKLLSYSWPGNIRELRNAIIKAALATDEAEIRAQHLPLPVLQATAPPADPATLDLGDLEKHMIHKVMLQTGGHHQRAADLLGISKRTLSRKLKLYDASVQGSYAS